MKPAPFAYSRPESLQEALDVLASDPEAKVLAGGQSLVPMLAMRLAAPSALVDINGLGDLAYVRSDESGVRIGALARHSQVEADVDARRVQPLLALGLGGGWGPPPTIRNRGTTVGSMIHADSAAEMPVVLLLLGGSVSVASPEGTRTIPAADLYVGPLETSLRHDEIATEAFFPALPEDAGVAFKEVSRRQGDYALCGVAVIVRTDESGRVYSVRAGYLSVSETPTVVDLSESFSSGEMDQNSLDDAAELALSSLDPQGDIHATAAYRAQLARTLTKRTIRAAVNDAHARRTEGQS